MSFKSRLLGKVANLVSDHLERRFFTQPRFIDVINTKSLESFDIRKFAQIKVALEAAEFYNSNLYNAEYYDSYLEHLRAMARRAAVAGDGAFLEFGVATGTTIKAIAEASSRPVVGFDSFEGLPENWRYGVKRGSFAGKVPNLPKGVSLKIGLIENTLPSYLRAMPERHISFMHIDTDLYAPAKFILSECKPYLFHTIIVFDEFLNYPGWRDHEYKAFSEFQAENVNMLEFEYLGLGGTVAVSVKVTRKSKASI